MSIQLSKKTCRKRLFGTRLLFFFGFFFYKTKLLYNDLPLLQCRIGSRLKMILTVADIFTYMSKDQKQSYNKLDIKYSHRLESNFHPLCFNPLSLWTRGGYGKTSKLNRNTRHGVIVNLGQWELRDVYRGKSFSEYKNVHFVHLIHCVFWIFASLYVLKKVNPAPALHWWPRSALCHTVLPGNFAMSSSCRISESNFFMVNHRITGSW